MHFVPIYEPNPERHFSNSGVSGISHGTGIFQEGVRGSPPSRPCSGPALRCSHSQQLLAPLGSDSQRSYKMPYFLAVSLFKNKNAFTRPWHSCCLSLVTASFPGASASSSPSMLPSPQLLTLACLSTAGSGHRGCQAHVGHQLFSRISSQIQARHLHPSNPVGLTWTPEETKQQTLLSSCSRSLWHVLKRIFPKQKPDRVPPLLLLHLLS